MAFVLSSHTRPSSPRPHITHHEEHDHDSFSLPRDISDPDMGQHKERSHIEIRLDEQYLKLKGTGPDVEPVRMSGHVLLTLTEDTSLKEVTLSFRGKARVPIPASESMISTGTYATYIVCANDWSFLEGDKRHSRTLKAGRHFFPFQLQLGGSLPSTVASPSLGGVSVSYKLRATATRPGIMANNLACLEPVYIMRTFTHEALEYQTTLEIENSWPEKIMYSIMLPHKAWAAGDTLQALVKFSPLTKGAAVLSVMTTVQENIKAYARSGYMEENKTVATAKHEIVHGKAVPVDELRPGLGSTTPNASSSSSSTHHAMEVHHHHHHDGAEVTQLSPVAGPSRNTSPPPPESIDQLYSSENNDVVTHVSLDLPPGLTPSSPLEPIMIHHRVKWSILILNPDGHTSELRCSLPIHILDHHLLPEAKAHTAATRRLLFGVGETTEEEEDQELPSYTAHVRDRVANMFLPETATMRIINPWIAQGTSPTVGEPHDPLSLLPRSRESGHSTPLEAHLLSHLPHAPGSGDSTPLDWVNSELLLSLSENPPPVPGRHPVEEAGSGEQSRPHSRWGSRPGSTAGSRPHSRASSPGPETSASASSTDLREKEYVHNGHASRKLSSLVKATMKPFTALSGHHGGGLFSRHSSQMSVSQNQMHPNQIPSASSSSRESLPTNGRPINLGQVNVRLSEARERDREVTAPQLLHRAFTEVPDYTIASRGFIGGVPPLESMQGLPSYEESEHAGAGAGVARSMSESDLTRLVTVGGEGVVEAGRREGPRHAEFHL